MSGSRDQASFTFDKLGNRHLSAAERAILLQGIRRDERRLEMIRKDIQTSENDWRVARATFDASKTLLDDSNLRLRTITSIKTVTATALEILEGFSLVDEDKARLGGATTGASHLAIANKLLKQQERLPRQLDVWMSVLKTAEQDARAAVEKEQQAQNVTHVQLCGFKEDLRMYRDQEEGLKASIEARRGRFFGVRKLTSEIWLQIFQFVAFSPPKWQWKAPSMTTVFNPAFSLKHVCKTWDAIIAENGSLWGCIYITSLALTKWNIRFIEHCIEFLEKKIFVLRVQTDDGNKLQAHVLTELLSGFTIHEIQIHSTHDSQQAVLYLLQNLPTPTTLSIRNMEKGKMQMLEVNPQAPASLLNVIFDNAALFPAQNQGTYDSVKEITLRLPLPHSITSYLGMNFKNVTSITLAAEAVITRNAKARKHFLFPNLARITALFPTLINTFDELCQMPALCEIGTWINGASVPEVAHWRRFLQRGKLKDRLKTMEIMDMEPVYVETMVEYLLELHKIPHLTLTGRTVDILSQTLISPKSTGRPLDLQALSVKEYAGNGQPIHQLVKAYACGRNVYPSPIKEVTWIDCCNVTPQMHRDVERICQGDLTEDAPLPVEVMPATMLNTEM